MKKGRLTPERGDAALASLIAGTLTLRRRRAGRPRDRGGVRGHGRQAGGVPAARRRRRSPARSWRPTRRRSTSNRIAAVDAASAGRDRHALLQPGQRDEAAGDRARRGDRADEALATVMQLGEAASARPPSSSGVCDGFIGNRMLEQYVRQAEFLLEEGARPQQVDRALEDFGMAMGPFAMGDLAGNDIGWPIRKRRYVEKPEVTYSRIGRPLCERGRFGQKTGAGWYRLRSKASRTPIPRSRSRRADRAPIARRSASRHARSATSEIVDRCVLALVNEGAPHPRRRHRAARLRHRRGLPHRLRLSGSARRPDVLRRHARVSTTSRARCIASPPCRARTPRSGSPRRCWHALRPRVAPSMAERDFPKCATPSSSPPRARGSPSRGAAPST